VLIFSFILFLAPFYLLSFNGVNLLQAAIQQKAATITDSYFH